jgi:hypothetical protein
VDGGVTPDSSQFPHWGDHSTAGLEHGGVARDGTECVDRGASECAPRAWSWSRRPQARLTAGCLPGCAGARFQAAPPARGRAGEAVALGEAVAPGHEAAALPPDWDSFGLPDEAGPDDAGGGQLPGGISRHSFYYNLLLATGREAREERACM